AHGDGHSWRVRVTAAAISHPYPHAQGYCGRSAVATTPGDAHSWSACVTAAGICKSQGRDGTAAVWACRPGPNSIAIHLLDRRCGIWVGAIGRVIALREGGYRHDR